MTKHRFKLEPVLHYRRFKEKEHRTALRESIRQLEEEESLLSELSSTRQDWSRRLQERQTAGLKPVESRLHIRYLQRIAREIETQDVKVRQEQKAVDQKRREFLKSVKELRIMDRLKEKREEAESCEHERREQSFLNDIAVARHNRNRTDP